MKIKTLPLTEWSNGKVHRILTEVLGSILVYKKIFAFA